VNALSRFLYGLLAAGALTEFAAQEVSAQLLSRDDVPSEVISAFEGAHPNATVKSYSKEERGGATVYEIESMEGSRRRDFVYTEDGALLETEEPLPPGRLPDPVKQALSAQFPDYRIISAEKLTRKGAPVEYGVVIRKGKKRLEVRCDKSGNVLETSRPQ
jgi:hypothetical protein